jgi:hypothetical protein
VRFGALWISLSPAQLVRLKFEEIDKFESDPAPRGIPPGILMPGLNDKYGKLHAATFPSNPGAPWPLIDRHVAFGAVPTSITTCKCYFLLKKARKVEVWDNQDMQRTLETFDSVFAEDFYFFFRKNDYFFVTESGKLYQAPPRKQGEKERKMRPLWTDVDRPPIVAILEDADNDRVWLFAKDKSRDGKNGVYFEMKATLKPQAFDHAKLPTVNVEGRARILLEFLPLIRSEPKKK